MIEILAGAPKPVKAPVEDTTLLDPGESDVDLDEEDDSDEEPVPTKKVRKKRTKK